MNGMAELLLNLYEIYTLEIAFLLAFCIIEVYWDAHTCGFAWNIWNGNCKPALWRGAADKRDDC